MKFKEFWSYVAVELDLSTVLPFTTATSAMTTDVSLNNIFVKVCFITNKIKFNYRNFKRQLIKSRSRTLLCDVSSIINSYNNLIQFNLKKLMLTGD